MSDFATALARLAREERAQYGGMAATQPPLAERIDEYWHFVERPDLRGGAWSAAFISFLVYRAGGGAGFRYSCRHADYIGHAIGRRRAGDGGFVGYRPDEIELRPGDIVGMNRVDAPPIAYEWAAAAERYRSHCDVVVEVSGHAVEAIGGNVGAPPGCVGTKRFEWRASDGALANPLKPNQQVFVVIRREGAT